jgi:hypothetical protein
MQALKDMTKAYRDAYTVAVKNEKSNAWYPLSNAIAGAVALSWQPRARKDAAAGVDADMSKLRDYAKKTAASSRDFWELALPADILLLEAAVRGQLTANDWKAIESAYRDAGVRAGTPREIASATGQIEFLRDVAKSSKRQPITRLANSLEGLQGALTGEAPN